MKIKNDKYYTPKDLAKYLINKTIEIIGTNNITDIIEPSAGNGAFSTQVKCTAYDIEPQHNSIMKQDFLSLNIPYKKGRLFIGNPPFGISTSLSVKFYKKCVELGDYIAFILPISQLNTNRTFYEFDLIHSEDLGIADYSGVSLHCVFNIYKRSPLGLNKKPKSKLDSIKIYRQDRKGYNDLDFDVRMCYWGNATAGKILYGDECYAGEYKIVISDSIENKKEIVDFIKNYDWNGYIQGIAMKRLKQFHIIEVLKENFSNLR